MKTNKLIKFYKGVDGLKTGFTDNAKYCLVATMNKNDMRLISVILGEDTKENRTTDTVNLLEYAFSNYGTKTIINKNVFHGKMYISNSSNKEYKYYLDSDVKLVLSKDRSDVSYKTNTEIYNLKAPIDKDTVIGKLTIEIDDEEYEYNLINKDYIKKANYFEVMYNVFNDIISGKVSNLF